MRKIYILAALLCCVFSACKPKPAKTAVIIVDGSNSIVRMNAATKQLQPKKGDTTQDAGNFLRLLQCIDEIPGKLTNEGNDAVDVYFLAVANSVNEAPLSRIPYQYAKVNEVEQERQNATNRAILKMVKTNLRTHATDTSQKTCLLTTIEHAATLLQYEAKRKATDTMHIIILSDMVDVCQESLIGKSNFALQDSASLDTTMKRIEAMQPGFSLSNPLFKITVVDVAPHTSAPRRKILTSVWSAIFRKLGYEKPVEMLTGIPASF
jgi:hypothetical protein